MSTTSCRSAQAGRRDAHFEETSRRCHAAIFLSSGDPACVDASCSTSSARESYAPDSMPSASAMTNRSAHAWNRVPSCADGEATRGMGRTSPLQYSRALRSLIAPARACNEVTFCRPMARIRSPLARTASSKASREPASAALGIRFSSSASNRARRSSDLSSGSSLSECFASSQGSPSKGLPASSPRMFRRASRTCRAAERSRSDVVSVNPHGQGRNRCSDNGSSGAFHASPTTASSKSWACSPTK